MNATCFENGFVMNNSFSLMLNGTNLIINMHDQSLKLTGTFFKERIPAYGWVVL
ncbi:MAG: hypothetical protein ABI761_13300 [Saprospiraceae bacterium]